MSELNTLYRFFDRAGQLLYIGITVNPPARFRDHQNKTWWHLVTTIALETHATQASLLEAEQRAIVAERPLFNVVHNTPIVVENSPRKGVFTLQPAICAACGQACLYDPAWDIYRHDPGTAPIWELRGTQTMACYLDIVHKRGPLTQ